LKNKLILIILFILLSKININPDNLSLIGNYIKLVVSDDNGGFNLYGKNNIGDKWLPLLFEDFPPTSYFRFFMDQKKLPFGFGGRGRYSEIEIRDKSVYYFWQDKKIKIELVYQLVSSVDSSNADTLIIDLNIINLTYDVYNIEYFLCLDTLLGESSDKHFILSDKNVLNFEREFIDTSNISSIQSYDDKSKLGVNIILNQKNQITPTRIFFANWKRVESQVGLYKVRDQRIFDLKPYSINDSAVFIEYTNQEIIPEKNNHYRFIISMKSNFIENIDTEELITEVDNNSDMDSDNLISSNTDNNNDALNNNADKTNDINLDELNFINMSLKDLLDLLDKINNKLKSNDLTDKDVNTLNSILAEIKKRRGYK